MTIKVETVGASIHKGKKIWSARLITPRLIWQEVMTHRSLSKNAASSRAIPIKAMNEFILNDIAAPVRFGGKNAGMQDNGPHNAPVSVPLDIPTVEAVFEALCGVLIDKGIPDADFIKKIILEGAYIPEMSNKQAWEYAIKRSIEMSNAFDKAGYHKQVANRLTEAGQHMTTIITGTDWDNFFHLRRDFAADPTMNAVADALWEAYSAEDFVELDEGDWHTPMFGAGYWLKDCGIPLQDALMISSSCCAQASYRKADDTLSKAIDIYDRLVNDERVHASPFEHQATPIVNVVGKNDSFNPKTWEDGVTHVTKDGSLCSGNLKGWIQHRQLIPNNVCNYYMPEGK